MRSLSKICMDILEDATYPCEIAITDDVEDWDWEEGDLDEDAGDEIVERGLAVRLPCVACEKYYQDDRIFHHHLTLRGVTALHFYREHKELLR